MMEKKKQGFGAIDPEQQRAIARKGGEAVSRNREHMAAIGRKGGERSGEARSKQKEQRDDLPQ
jgi:uncharacterized protein